MEKEYAPSASEKKQMKTQAAKAPVVQKIDKKTEEKKEEVKSEVEVKPQTDNKEAKPEVKEEKKGKKEVITKKEDAMAQGLNLSASKRHCVYICKFIKNKPIDVAIKDLGDVIKFKRAVPMKGEIPHRKGKGMMSGRYPIKVAGLFIPILKGLKGNAIVNGLDIEKTRIYYCSANWAPRPMKGGGARFKRSHVMLKAKEVTKLEAKK